MSVDPRPIDPRPDHVIQLLTYISLDCVICRHNVYVCVYIMSSTVVDILYLYLDAVCLHNLV